MTASGRAHLTLLPVSGSVGGPARTGPADAAARDSDFVNRQLDAIATTAEEINLDLPLASLLDRIADRTCQLMGYDFCTILLHGDNGELRIEGSHGLRPSYVRGVTVRIADGRPLSGVDPARSLPPSRPISTWTRVPRQRPAAGGPSQHAGLLGAPRRRADGSGPDQS